MATRKIAANTDGAPTQTDKNGAAKLQKGTEAYELEKANRAFLRALERIRRAREAENSGNGC